MIALSPEVKPVENTIDTSNLNETTSDELKELADGIVNDPKNQEQAKMFPDVWNSLNNEEKIKIAGQLTTEIQDSIKELKDLGVEYSPEISQKDIDNVAALEFVRANKEKVPQSWIKLENKANEVAKDIGKEITDRGLLNHMDTPFDNQTNKAAD